MTQVQPRTLWLLLLPVLAVAVAWWRHAESSASSRPAVAEASAEAATHTPAERWPLQLQRERLRSTAVASGLPLDPRSGFEREPDLYRYLQTLAAPAAAGDQDARWMVSRVYDYCAGYAMDPAAYAADSDALGQLQLQGAAAMSTARQRVLARCAGFLPRDGLTRAAIAEQRRQAAEAGSIAAEAALLAQGQPLQASAQYRRGLVERVLVSRDPEAFLALSPAMGLAASGDDAYEGLVAGSAMAELAWQLAACRLGLACGPDSVLMTNYCANGGICSQDPTQDFYAFVFDAAVPRQGASTMENMVSQLIEQTGERS
ncbi:hypothetical protein [Stenotrophomonas sp. MMGLT7]|uniref:hypothetical protein n=1 Tax=Stenotrophomonas sp. MMGLT7 TaxID=2901227 RepID=UPI001E3F8FDB|nr:hypothetical protein [Stenotrophomonas sp. MMGLT7]MCD7097893.1 hypothetical protein [Stenotrophomonas sp. MMGLT7]